MTDLADRTDRACTFRLTLAAEHGLSTDVEVCVSGSSTVGELLPSFAEALGSPWGEDLWIGHQRFFADTPIRDVPLADGITLRSHPPGAPPPDAKLELRGVAGARSGQLIRLAAGHYELGHNLRATLQVAVDSTTELLLTPAPGTPAIVNGEARPGTTRARLNDVLEIGATAWQVAAPPSIEPSIPARIFNRPPRTLPPELPSTIDPPSRDKVRESSRTFRIAMVLAPLLMGGIMVLVFQRWFYAVFMLMSPVIMGFNVLDDRLRRRKGSRRAEADFRKSVGDFTLELADWRARLHLAAGTPQPGSGDHGPTRPGARRSGLGAKTSSLRLPPTGGRVRIPTARLASGGWPCRGAGDRRAAEPADPGRESAHRHRLPAGRGRRRHRPGGSKPEPSPAPCSFRPQSATVRPISRSRSSAHLLPHPNGPGCPGSPTPWACGAVACWQRILTTSRSCWARSDPMLPPRL